MTNRIWHAPQSRDPRDYDTIEGGYTAADGSICSSSGPAPGQARPSPPPTADGPRPHPDAVKGLVKKASRPTQVALIERKSPEGTQLQVGSINIRGRDGRPTDVRAAGVEATVPLGKTQSLKAQALHGKLHVGDDNPDGSKGFNLGVGATAASVEWSYSSGSASMSIGASVGAEAALSVGTRDADGNGVPEACISVDAAISVAVCSEPEAPPQREGPADGARGTGGRPPSAGAGGTSGW